MASTPKNLALAQLASTTRTTIYTAPTGFNATSAVLAFTNTTTTAIEISIYHGNGTDFLLKTITLPAGIGREVIYDGFSRRVVNTGETVKIQADSTSALNYSFSGAEVSV